MARDPPGSASGTRQRLSRTLPNFTQDQWTVDESRGSRDGSEAGSAPGVDPASTQLGGPSEGRSPVGSAHHDTQLRSSTPTPLPRIDRRKGEKRASTAGNTPVLRKNSVAVRPGTCSRSDSVPAWGNPAHEAAEKLCHSWGSLVDSKLVDSKPPILSPSSQLKRENGQLRRELEQMQASVLESMRRTDRFISGGQFRGKNNSQPSPQQFMKEREEVRRSKIRELDSQREKEHLEAELRRATEKIAELEASMASLQESLSSAQNSSLNDEALSDVEALHRTERAELEARIHALETDNETLRRTADDTQARLEESQRKNAEDLEEMGRLHEAARRGVLAELDSTKLSVDSLVAELEAERLAKAQLAEEEARRLREAQNSWNEELVATRSGFQAQCSGLESALQAARSDLEALQRQRDAEFFEQQQLLQQQLQQQAEAEAQASSKVSHSISVGTCTEDGGASASAVRSTALKFLKKLGSGMDDAVCTRLVFHGWQSEVARSLRAKAAEMNEKERSQRDALALSRDASLAELNEERSRLRDSILKCSDLESERRSLTEKVTSAQESWKHLQDEVARLRKRADDAEEALRKERAKNEHQEAEQRRTSKDLSSATEAAQLALLEGEKRAAQAMQRLAEAEARERALRTQLAKEQESSSEQSSRIQRLIVEAEERRRLVEELRSERNKLREEHRSMESRLSSLRSQNDKLQRQLEELQSKHSDEMDALQRSVTQDKLRQMLRLQVLAPQVTVSISGSNSVDVKGAPSAGQIKKVMMETVLPRFAQVLVQEDNQSTSSNKQTEQYVQSVMNSMVVSIEEKLQTVLGSSCVRTTSGVDGGSPSAASRSPSKRHSVY